MLEPSELIARITYDGDRAKLEVAFHSGVRFVYVGVPGEVHRSFVDAHCPADFFVAEIRDSYPFNRLDA
mgnify:CR=1 FL=1